jgi:hypothetical protein
MRYRIADEKSGRGRSVQSARAEFPGARVETLADAPTHCTCGATWVAEDGGLACRMCGRRFYVMGELRRFVQRRGF